MKILATLFIAITALTSFSSYAEIAVIVNPSVNMDSITAEQLERLYLHRADRFPNKVKLVPVDQASGSEIRKEFTRKVLWKNEIELAEYWSRRMFSGKGRPPRQYESDVDVINAVVSRPGTIGYIDGDSVGEQVKVILRIP